eukprot:TRINITY_DN41556_c0_g1_i1.p1 TRINITY_DN41556_c0_g1~~TRINITY_DN41556_c0_g1_i1.p1  ORF type:complete len:452 (-),score=20.08 TRINITY_DN41556_c0_g1_i1:72-1427(-)
MRCVAIFGGAAIFVVIAVLIVPTLKFPKKSQTPRAETPATRLPTYPAAPVASSHSAHLCVGEDYHPVDEAWKYRTCLIRGICYNHSHFLYYASDTEPTVLSENLAVSASVMGNWTSVFGRTGVLWKPEIVTGSLPGPPARLLRTLIESRQKRVIPDQRPEVDVFFVPFLAFSMAHFLFDTLLPVYHAARLFGLEEARLIPIQLPTNPPLGCEAFRKRFKRRGDYGGPAVLGRCEDNYKRMVPMLFDENIQTLQQWSMRRHRKEIPQRCSRLSLVGIGQLSDHCDDASFHGRYHVPGTCNLGRGSMLWDFRNHILRRQGALVLNRTETTEAVVLFCESASFGRGIASWAPVANPLTVALQRGDLPRGTVIRRQNLAQLSLPEQFELLQRTTVLVSVCGGSAAFSALFLPRGATVVLPCPTKVGILDWNLLAHPVYWAPQLLAEPPRSRSTYL